MFGEAHDGVRLKKERSSPALCGYPKHRHQHQPDQQHGSASSWWSRRRRPHRHGRSTAASSAREPPDRPAHHLADAPHCLTCYCLPAKPSVLHHDGSEATSPAGAGDYPRGSGRRSARKTASTTVDELIREMRLKGSPQQRAQTPPATAPAALRHQVEEEEEEEQEESGLGDYRRQPGAATTRSCERWPAAAQRATPTSRSDFVRVPNVEPERTECPASSSSGVDEPTATLAVNPSEPRGSADSYLSRGSQLRLAEDQEDQEDEEEEEEDAAVVVAEPEPEPEAHVRELKLVRCQFIERILEETQKLHRLQCHLDGWSPRARPGRTRTVSTMTNGLPKEPRP